MFRLRFLKTENVGPMFLNKGLKKALFVDRANAVDVPREDFHREMIADEPGLLPPLAVESFVDVPKVFVRHMGAPVWQSVGEPAPSRIFPYLYA